MAVQTVAPISRVDVDRLYVDSRVPQSWQKLEERTLELLEDRVISSEQSRVLTYVLQVLEEQQLPVPQDSGDLYLMMRPMLEKLPGGYG